MDIYARKLTTLGVLILGIAIGYFANQAKMSTAKANASQDSQEPRSYFGVMGRPLYHVFTVEPGSPADKAGIRMGDTITTGSDNPKNWEDLINIESHEPGETIRISIFRPKCENGLLTDEVIFTRVTLAKR